MKAYRELSSLLGSRFYLDRFITGLFKASIMSRSLKDADAGGLHRRKNVERQENLKVFKKPISLKKAKVVICISVHIHLESNSGCGCFSSQSLRIADSPLCD